MKIFIKIILPFIFLSCSSRDIKISKYANINDKDEYENNYLSYEKESIDQTKFLSFFFNNIFNPPKKKVFPKMSINKKVYEKNISLLTWGGHSTFLFQKDNFNIVL